MTSTESRIITNGPLLFLKVSTDVHSKMLACAYSIVISSQIIQKVNEISLHFNQLIHPTVIIFEYSNDVAKFTKI